MQVNPVKCDYCDEKWYGETKELLIKKTWHELIRHADIILENDEEFQRIIKQPTKGRKPYYAEHSVRGVYIDGKYYR